MATTSKYFRKEASMPGKKKRPHVKIGTAEQPDNKQSKIEGPENWELVYNNILEMRKERNAPVDTMGCEKAGNLVKDPKVRLSLLPIVL